MWKLMGVLCTVSGCKIWKIFLMENIRLHGMPTTSFEMVLLWKVKRYSYQFFYFLFYISFYISRHHFYNFLEFHSTLSEKNFRPKLSFLNRFTHLPQPHCLIGQNLLNVTKVFCRFSLKSLMKYLFSKHLLTKSCKAFFKSSNYRFFGLNFKT